MDSIDYLKKSVPLTKIYDVVIVGGGTAGSLAAISSGRMGLDALLIEQFGALGGSQTMAMVTPVMSSCLPNDKCCSALHLEITSNMTKIGSATDHSVINETWFDMDRGSWFDPVMLKVVLEDLVVKAGCKILYHTVLVDVVKEDDKIQSVIVNNKNGLCAIRAKKFIDCTGDADLAFLAGVSTQSGNDEGVNQAVSLRFEMANVDVEKFGLYLKACGQRTNYTYPFVTTDCSNTPKFREFILEMHKKGELTDLDVSHFQMFSIPGKLRSMSFNCPELGTGTNVIDSEFMSEKQIQGKIGAVRIANFMKKYVPGFEGAYICEIAPMLGIRESRRIKAIYQFTSQDVFEYRKFSDGIATSNYPLDVHGKKVDDMHAAYIEKEETERYYEIPYRSLVPENIDNLLVAGRCIGVDYYAQSTVRVQHTCRAMGEAAGIAAAISIEKNISFKNLDGGMVRQVIIENGAQF